MKLDPEAAALYAIVAICLVLIGAILTPGTVGLAERGSVLAAIAAILLTVAWRAGRRGPRDD